MVHSHDKKIIFIHIPKCGGTSIEFAFDLKTPKDGYGIKNRKAMQHYLWHDYKRELGDKIFNNYFKFAIVRNPYTRFISEYYWCSISKIGNKGGQSIDSFITYCKGIVDKRQYNKTAHHDHFMPQYLYVYDDNDSLKVNKLFKYENYQAVQKFMLNKYNVKVGHVMKGKYDKNKVILTQSQKDRIYEIYKQDFIRFGYQK